MMQLLKNISRCNFLIKFVLQNACPYLKSRYSERMALRVQEYGYPLIEEDKENGRGNLKQIYMVESEVKTQIVLLNQYNREWQQRYPNDTAPVERTLMDYDKELAILSKFMGHWIRRKKITVWEFCSIVNAYNEYIKANKSKS